MTLRRAACYLVVPMLGCAALAQTGGGDRPVKAVVALLTCRRLVDPNARLACYDDAVATFATALSRKDVTVLDAEQIATTRRGLFGFSLPRLPWLSGAASANAHGNGERVDAEVDRIQGTIKTASRAASGRWIIVLEDGARWEQIESSRDADEPRADMPILIERASLGSYFCRIGPYIRMRVRRTG